jgi:hypothetical protein
MEPSLEEYLPSGGRRGCVAQGRRVAEMVDMMGMRGRVEMDGVWIPPMIQGNDLGGQSAAASEGMRLQACEIRGNLNSDFVEHLCRGI